VDRITRRKRLADLLDAEVTIDTLERAIAHLEGIADDVPRVYDELVALRRDLREVRAARSVIAYELYGDGITLDKGA
jgi:hypothetical protein